MFEKFSIKNKYNPQHTNGIVVYIFVYRFLQIYRCIYKLYLQNFVIKLIFNSWNAMLCMWLRKKAIQKVFIFKSQYKKEIFCPCKPFERDHFCSLRIVFNDSQWVILSWFIVLFHIFVSVLEHCVTWYKSFDCKLSCWSWILLLNNWVQREEKLDCLSSMFTV